MFSFIPKSHKHFCSLWLSTYGYEKTYPWQIDDKHNTEVSVSCSTDNWDPLLVYYNTDTLCRTPHHGAVLPVLTCTLIPTNKHTLSWRYIHDENWRGLCKDCGEL